MSLYTLAFLWGFFILGSLIGWGTIVNKTILRQYCFDWGQKAAWGIALSISAGGILNLCDSISNTIIWIYLSIGLLSLIADFLQNFNRRISTIIYLAREYFQQPLTLILLLITLSLVLIAYSGWVFTDAFHSHDDFFAYLVFPNKMLQTGSLDLDPFSRRRLESALGGQSFLHTFVLSILPEESLRIIDPGIGFIVSLGLLFGYLSKQGISHDKCFLALLPFLLSIPPFRNTTSIVIALCLFLCLFRTLYSSEIRQNHLLARVITISLVVAAIFASKNTLIPIAFVMVTLSYMIDFFSSRSSKKAMLELAAIALLTFLLIVPWMISLYQSSGTLLYPFLGKGYHASAYYDYYTHRTSDLLSFKGLKDIAKALLHVSHLCLFILTVIYIFSKTWRKEYLREQKSVLSLIFATWLGVLIYLLLAGVVAPRYTYPFVYTAIAVLWSEIVFVANKRRKFRLNWSFIAAVAATLLLIGNGDGPSKSVAYYKAQLQSARQALTMTHLLSDEQEAQSYLEMQSSIPHTALLLARLEKPFLLDFSRNPIFIVDSPGHASLPPGMPLFKGSEALAKYLTNQGIRYVAYSYKREPGAQRAYWVKRLGSEIYPWVEPNRIIQVLRPSLRSEVQYTLDFQENLRLLGHSRKRIFDNGKMFILDLLQP